MNIALQSIYRQITTREYILKKENEVYGASLNYPFRILANYANKNMIRITTPDMLKRNDIDVVLFLEIPDQKDSLYQYSIDHDLPMYGLVQENGLIWKNNFDTSKHIHFRKVFTYYDEQIDDVKYIKTNYSFSFPDNIPGNFDKRKFCVMISSNKNLKHPLELYSKRIEAIRWFETFHQNEFDLYGHFWIYEGKFKKLLRHFLPTFPSYKGKTDNKLETLSAYKFCFCYENVRDIPGYITEKIFDCLFAGCIPIYWGANNISDYIPNECFIDKRKFNNMESLYAYLRKFKKYEFESFHEAVIKFFKSRKAKQFTADRFAHTILDTIIKDLN